MLGLQKVVFLSTSIFIAVSYARPSPGWLMLRNALAPSLRKLSMLLSKMHELISAELEARQTNETAGAFNTTSSTPPAALNCTIAISGDTCDIIASELGVSTSDFLAANPSVDAACDDLLAGVEYCV